MTLNWRDTPRCSHHPDSRFPSDKCSTRPSLHHTSPPCSYNLSARLRGWAESFLGICSMDHSDTSHLKYRVCRALPAVLRDHSDTHSLWNGRSPAATPCSPGTPFHLTRKSGLRRTRGTHRRRVHQHTPECRNTLKSRLCLHLTNCAADMSSSCQICTIFPVDNAHRCHQEI